MDLLGGLCGTLLASLLGAGAAVETPPAARPPQGSGGSGKSVRSRFRPPFNPRPPDTDDEGETAALIAFLLGDD